MAKPRVYELAKELGLTSPEVIEKLKALGIDAKAASSSIDEDVATKFKRHVRLEGVKGGKKRVYGSDDDDDERDAAQRAHEERVAAEKAERERAAQEAAAAREARKSPAKAKTPRATARPVEKEVRESEEAPAIAHRPGAPRLRKPADAPASEPSPAEVSPAEVPSEDAPRPVAETATPSSSGALESPAEAAGTPSTEIPEAPPAAEPTAPAFVAKAVAKIQPLRPLGVRIAPPKPPSRPEASFDPNAPAAGGDAAAAARPAAARPIRPIAAPSRPSGPHRVAPRPVATGARPGMRGPHGAGSGQAARGGVPGASGSPTGTPGRPGDRRPTTPARRGPKEKAEKGLALPQTLTERPKWTGPLRPIVITEGVTVKELSEKMPDAKSRDILKFLISKGAMMTVNQTLELELAKEVAREFGYEATVRSYEEEVVQEQSVETVAGDAAARAPIVTVMGHVDHGKTSLLDAIRETAVAEREHGGITQHIGAYHVDVGPRKVVFLDTPGHEAFTLMRARGARVTDIVVLVVAADDGVMPQTLEALDHAKAAGVPIVVAVNKIDKPEAQPDRVRQQLADRGLLPEEWGGQTIFVNVSAKKKQNLDQLLEMLLLTADMGQFVAFPQKAARGTVLEARLDKGRGPVANVLIQDGTLRIGDVLVAGSVSGRVRGLMGDRGERLREAGPSTPVEIQGLEDVPAAGDSLFVVEDSVKAHTIVAFRQQKLKEKQLAMQSRVRLEDVAKVGEAGPTELPIVLKGDVQGSIEALAEQLRKIPQEKIRLRVIRSGVGAINEGDVLLAAASGGIVVGFNVRPERKAAESAERDDIEVRLYTIIYDVVDDMKKALEGRLAPTFKEVVLGGAKVLNTFKISKIGTIAGTMVTDGKVNRSASVRLLRDNIVIHTGKVSSLKRFKDDASEVKQGLECGIGIQDYNDIKVGDVIQFFTQEKVKTTL